MKIPNRQILSILLMGTIVVAGGCNTTQGGAAFGSAPVVTVDRSYPGATLVYGSEALAGAVRISDPRFQTVGQLTRAQVTVENPTETRYTLEYKFDWEDMTGFSVDNIGTWQRFTVAPREVRKFTSTGKIPEAKHIIFTLRLPDDTFIKSPSGKK